MQRLLKHTLALLVTIGVLDWIGNTLYLYWTVWWYDMLMHFISGVCVGLIVIILWKQVFVFNHRFLKYIAVGVLGGLAIGLVWEVYELYFGITTLSDGMRYWTDTISDVVLDVLGGSVAGLYVNKILR